MRTRRAHHAAPLAFVLVGATGLGVVAHLATARAQAEPPTTLLTDDMNAHRRVRIDEASADLGLEDLIGVKGGFTTNELDKIADRVHAELGRDHLRPPPRTLTFTCPGRYTAAKLREQKDLTVDADLVVDPCDRALCRDVLGRYVELFGRAAGAAELSGAGYVVHLRHLTLTAVGDPAADGPSIYRGPIADAVAASGRMGGGRDWLDDRKRQEDRYEPTAAKAVAQKIAARRLSVAKAPAVSREAGEVTVRLRLRGDRSRYAQQAADGMVAAVAALRELPSTPPVVHVETEIEVPMGRPELHRYRALGQSIALFLDGKIDAGTLRESYIEELHKGAEQMNFNE